MAHDPLLLVNLPPEQRLAIAYGRARSRRIIGAVLALDARLAAIVRSVSEPLIGQVQLAWWRDQMALPPETRAKGQPVLQALVDWGAGGPLSRLVDCWEEQLLDAGTGRKLAEARADCLAACSRLLNVADHETETRRAGLGWALADQASGHWGAISTADLDAIDWSPVNLPSEMRPIAVLFALARRGRGTRPLLDSPLAMVVAMRVGLVGR